MIEKASTNIKKNFLSQKVLFISIFWGSLAGVFNQGLNFISNIILVRFLGVEYATLVLYGSTNSMFQGFALVGLNVFATVIVAKNLNNNKTRLGKLIPNMYFIVTSLIILISAISLLINYFEFYKIKFWSLDSPFSLFFIILWLITSTLDTIQVSILLGFGAFKDIAKVSLIKGLFTITILLFFVQFYGIQGVLIAYALAYSLSLLFNLYFLKKNCKKNGLILKYEIDSVLLKHILKSSFPIFLASLIMIPSQWVINYIIYSKENGKLALTIFGMANQWMILIQFFPLQISKVILPQLSKQKNNQQEFKSTEKTGLKISILISLILISFSILLESYIINMYNLNYSISKYPFRIMLMAALFSTVNLFLGQSMVASGRVWLRTLVDVFISLSLFTTFMIVLSSSVMLALPIAYSVSFLVGSTLVLFLRKNKTSN
jgi:O-antigen/teichoic acid export membrane protein